MIAVARNPQIILTAQRYHGMGEVKADLLEDIEAGDKVDFEFINTRDGHLVIIDMEPLD
ncbi:MAG: hypothetical protein ACE5ET_04445 [Gammaproteobacteria bacterium]